MKGCLTLNRTFFPVLKKPIIRENINSLYPRFDLNGSLLIYSGACKYTSPDALGEVDSNCRANSLLSSIRSILGA